MRKTKITTVSICCIEGTTNSSINGKCTLYVTSQPISTPTNDKGAKISQMMECNRIGILHFD